MAYIVIKTIKGRQYRYQQRTYRQGGKVRTETIYLGPVDGIARRGGILRRIGDFIEANRTRRNGFPDFEILLQQYNEIVARDHKARDEAVGQLHELYGLRMSLESHPTSHPAEVSSGTTSAENDHRDE